jgi:hypothetical protein
MHTQMEILCRSVANGVVHELARPDRGAVDEQNARKRARETSRQTGQRILDKKSPADRSPHNTTNYPVFLRH